MTKTTNTKKASTEKAFKDARKTVEKAVKEATNNLGNVAEFSKANYEALVASGEVAAKVAQAVNVDFVETAKKAVEKNVTDAKALFAAKTPAEFFELQATMFKSRYEEFVAEATRVNEVASTKANEVVEPLKARYEEVASKYNLPLVG